MVIKCVKWLAWSLLFLCEGFSWGCYGYNCADIPNSTYLAQMWSRPYYLCGHDQSKKYLYYPMFEHICYMSSICMLHVLYLFSMYFVIMLGVVSLSEMSDNCFTWFSLKTKIRNKQAFYYSPFFISLFWHIDTQYIKNHKNLLQI